MYKPHVDGLRALAVLLVVLFHAFPHLIPGGFVGVDIFFVISGYLISGLILNELAEERFSFVAFYSRRIRRIFPALLLVFGAVMAASYFLMFRPEYELNGRHLAGGAGFMANFLFLQEAGYFDLAAELKPLQHLWSLSVEEQYYLLWPAFLVICWKKRFQLNYFILGSTVIFFLIGLVLCWSRPSAGYYLPISRFWEILVGACLSYFEPNLRSKIKSFNVKETWVSFFGLVLILYSAFHLNENSIFPGIWALLPTIGGAMMIFSGAKSFLNQKVFSSQAMVKIGLISYPLYLWHWPLLSFARLIDIKEPLATTKLGLLSLSVVLAWLTFQYLEKPLRQGTQDQLVRLTGRLLIAEILFIGFGLAINSGIPTPHLQKYLDPYEKLEQSVSETTNLKKFENSTCLFTQDSFESHRPTGCSEEWFPQRPHIFVVGDSHSSAIAPTLRAWAFARKFNLSQFSAIYCTPLSELDKRKRCRDFNNSLMKEISDKKPDVIIITAYHAKWATDENYGEDVPYSVFMVRQTKKLVQLGARNVILVGQIPAWQAFVPQMMVRHFLSQGQQIPDFTSYGLRPETLKIDLEMEQQTYAPNVRYLSLRRAFCKGEECRPLVPVGEDRGFLEYDTNHLSAVGSKYLLENLLGPMIASQ